MTREELRAASEALRAAGEAIDVNGELRERLRNQAAQLAELADREPGPDHGRLDRHQRILDEIKSAVEDGKSPDREGEEAPSELIERADARIREYRETLEGV